MNRDITQYLNTEFDDLVPPTRWMETENRGYSGMIEPPSWLIEKLGLPNHTYPILTGRYDEDGYVIDRAG